MSKQGEKAALLSAIHEAVAQSLPQADAILTAMTGQPMRLQSSGVSIVASSALPSALPEAGEHGVSRVSMGFEGVVCGNISVWFPQQTISVLINTLTRSPMRSFEMDVFRIGTITEVGNIMMNAVMSGLSQITGETLQYALPSYDELGVDAWCADDKWKQALYAEMTLQVANLALPLWLVACMDDASITRLESLLPESVSS